ncbi:endonuclease domain-containing protein [Chryseobacterium sp.]|uniref:endonuclease domain-containing protein n=1 Tax=Chryseobacterium sp. TaxID=1871047 RepID=UPI002FC9401F
MLPKDELSLLRKSLESKESFLPLLQFFVKKSTEEIKEKEKNPENQLNYSNFYSTYTENYSKLHADLIFENCQSPIERIFISSLLLLFIKNGILGFSITPRLPDIEDSMRNYRKNHKAILKLINNYKDTTGDSNLTNFKTFFKETYINVGKYTEVDYYEVWEHYYIVKNFTFNSYHITLQPEFPNFKIDNKSIRPDILVWCPGNKKIKLIVECDGFQFHSSKQSFENDRRRDRLLKLNGYEVIRYSGSEIFRDPVGVSEDLYNFLKKYNKHKF